MSHEQNEKGLEPSKANNSNDVGTPHHQTRKSNKKHSELQAPIALSPLLHVPSLRAVIRWALIWTPPLCVLFYTNASDTTSPWAAVSSGGKGGGSPAAKIKVGGNHHAAPTVGSQIGTGAARLGDPEAMVEEEWGEWAGAGPVFATPSPATATPPLWVPAQWQSRDLYLPMTQRAHFYFAGREAALLPHAPSPADAAFDAFCRQEAPECDFYLPPNGTLRPVPFPYKHNKYKHTAAAHAYVGFPKLRRVRCTRNIMMKRVLMYTLDVADAYNRWARHTNAALRREFGAAAAAAGGGSTAPTPRPSSTPPPFFDYVRLLPDSGTLISVLRDGGTSLIPWDFDIDILVLGAEPAMLTRPFGDGLLRAGEHRAALEAVGGGMYAAALREAEGFSRGTWPSSRQQQSHPKLLVSEAIESEWLNKEWIVRDHAVLIHRRSIPSAFLLLYNVWWHAQRAALLKRYGLQEGADLAAAIAADENTNSKMGLSSDHPAFEFTLASPYEGLFQSYAPMRRRERAFFDKANAAVRAAHPRLRKHAAFIRDYASDPNGTPLPQMARRPPHLFDPCHMRRHDGPSFAPVGSSLHRPDGGDTVHVGGNTTPHSHSPPRPVICEYVARLYDHDRLEGTRVELFPVTTEGTAKAAYGLVYAPGEPMGGTWNFSGRPETVGQEMIVFAGSDPRERVFLSSPKSWVLPLRPTYRPPKGLSLRRPAGVPAPAPSNDTAESEEGLGEPQVCRVYGRRIMCPARPDLTLNAVYGGRGSWWRSYYD